MENVKEKKQLLRKEVEATCAGRTQSDLREKTTRIEMQLFEFANFKEAGTVLFYCRADHAVNTHQILQHCEQENKDIVLPLFGEDDSLELMKINQLATDVTPGRVLYEPNPERCKPVPFDIIDIAIVPGVAFDEKGARLGSGNGRYDRLIPKLPNTARKVALALEDQLISAIPMEPHDKFVDIIITEKRIIYKI
ncbi:MAG: 5-formyltetrahydrofolate cyclo-ligase [Thermodesulfobacteriota bacterium]